jgi:hypothetical protein
MTEHVVEIGDRLRFAERKLAGSNWTLREDLVLWLCLLRSLVSTTEGFGFLTTRLPKATEQLNIRCEEELEHALKGYLMLHKVPGLSIRNSYLLIHTSSAKL